MAAQLSICTDAIHYLGCRGCNAAAGYLSSIHTFCHAGDQHEPRGVSSSRSLQQGLVSSSASNCRPQLMQTSPDRIGGSVRQAVPAPLIVSHRCSAGQVICNTFRLCAICSGCMQCFQAVCSNNEYLQHSCCCQQHSCFGKTQDVHKCVCVAGYCA